MGTTTNYSLPWPAGSDFVANGATAIESLADAVDVFALPVLCTSTTRPASPRAGQTIYETDTGRALQRVASSWEIIAEPPQAWTVGTITAGVAVNVTTTYAYTQRSRGVWAAHAVLTIAGTGTANNAILVPTPFTLPDSNAIGGTWTYYDASATTYYSGTVVPFATTSFVMTRDGVGPVFGSAITVAAPDVLRLDLTGTY